MKKILFTGFLGLGLLLPPNISASTTSTASAKEFFKKPRKGKTKTSRKSKSSSSNYSSPRSYSSTSRSKGCTYNRNKLYVGPRGGCYYYSGSTKQYVDKSYCSSCN